MTNADWDVGRGPCYPEVKCSPVIIDPCPPHQIECKVNNVPEPPTLLLLAVGVVAVLLRRRK